MNPHPDNALFFHSASMESQERGVVSNHAYFATLHAVDYYAGRPQVREGRLLTHQDVMDLLERMASMKPKEALQVIDKRVIASGDDTLVWYESAQVRPIYFRIGRKNQKFTVPWPTLIFKAKGRSISVVASRFKRPPKLSEKIYHAPLMNVYQNTSVCTGSAICPDETTPASLSQWNTVIYDSNFTHTNHDHTLRQPGNKETTTPALHQFWRELRDKKTFPVRQLNPLDKTLEDWIYD